MRDELKKFGLFLVLTLSLWLSGSAQAAGKKTLVSELEIPANCELAYQQGAKLFASSMSIGRAAQRRLWAEQVDASPEDCRLFFSHGILDARTSFERQLILNYWLDEAHAGHEQWPSKMKAQLLSEAQQELSKYGLDPSHIAEGGDFAVGGELHRTKLPQIIHSWKEAARTSGRAQVFYRFIFTTGGAQERGYSLYDFERDGNGQLVRDKEGNPVHGDGSYGRAILRLIGYAQAVVKDYDRNRPSFLQRIFDPYYSFYAGSYAWDRPEKLAREIREDFYPKQMEAYVRMAKGLNLSQENLEIFHKLHWDLLHAQNENLAADDVALGKVKDFAINAVVGSALIFFGGPALAEIAPVINVGGFKVSAEAFMAVSTVLFELAGSQTVTAIRLYRQQNLNHRGVDWATYLDASVESAMDFVPVANLWPQVLVGTAQLKLLFSAGPRVLATIPQMVSAARGANLQSVTGALSRLPKEIWLHWWSAEGRAGMVTVLKGGARVTMIYSGVQVMTHQFSDCPEDRVLVLDENWHPVSFNHQVAVSMTYSALETVFMPFVVNSKALHQRYILKNLASLLSSVLAQEAVNRGVNWDRTRVDLAYSSAFSFWVLEGNRATLQQHNPLTGDPEQRNLVWTSLQFLKTATVDSELKDVFLSWYGGGRQQPLTQARKFLLERYHLDLSSISDEDLAAGIDMFLKYEGFPADTAVIDQALKRSPTDPAEIYN